MGIEALVREEGLKNRGAGVFPLLRMGNMSGMSEITSPPSPMESKPAGTAGVVLYHAPEPTPPSPEVMAAQSRFAVRVWSAFVFVICAGMLGVGFYLTPNNKLGMETHRQLGLPPCGFYFTTGLPCPTCGCTTAVSNLAHGNVLTSLATQPFGFAVGLLGLILVPLTAMGMVTGRWVGPSMFYLSWYWRVWVYGGLGLMAVAWGYKIVMVKSGHPL